MDNLLGKIKVLGELDNKIAREELKRTRSAEELQKLEAQVKATAGTLTAIEKNAAEQKGKVLRLELEIKESTEKLVARRKALATFSSSKAQVAAEREIDVAAKQINAQEEVVLKEMEILEAYDKKLVAAREAASTSKNEYEETAKHHVDVVEETEEHLLRYNQERPELVAAVPPRDIQTYNRVKGRFPFDPVVAITANSCGGCSQHIPPQIVIHAQKGDTVTQCPGCKRIIYAVVKAGE